MSWLQEVFGVSKPVIGMVHLPALPGAPLYDAEKGMEGILEWARRDLRALQAGGIDAVMFCNESDRPYTLRADPATVAAMAAVVGRLRDEIQVPFGIDILWDPFAALAVAHATGARFVREVFTGVYASDMGFWSPSAGEVLRYRRAIGAEGVRLLFNINAEFAAPMGSRPLAEVARSVAFSSLPDAICVSGPMTSVNPTSPSSPSRNPRASSGLHNNSHGLYRFSTTTSTPRGWAARAISITDRAAAARWRSRNRSSA